MLRTVSSNILTSSRSRILCHCSTSTGTRRGTSTCMSARRRIPVPTFDSSQRAGGGGALRVLLSINNISSRHFTAGDWQGRVSDVFSRGTKKAREAVQKTADSALDALEIQAKKASGKLSSEAQKVYEKGSSRASEVFQRSSTTASEAFAKGKTSAEDAIRSSSKKASEHLQAATDAAVKTSYHKVSQTGQAISHKSTQVANATSERIRNSSLGVLANAQEFTKKALRWFFWWSLAAVAVYGMATTIPTALIRYSLSSSGGSSRGGGSSSSSSSSSNNEDQLQPDNDAQGNQGWVRRWLLSRGGGQTTEEKTIAAASQNTPPITTSAGKDFWPLSWGNSSRTSSGGGKSD